MDELNSIIEVVADAMGMSAAALQARCNPHAIAAQRKVCHIVADGFPHLARAARDMFKMDRDEFYAMAREEASILAGDADAMYSMNGMRRELSLPAIKKNRLLTSARAISATKRMFGFNYTDSELARMHAAMESAASYMGKFCSHGRRPLEPGMVYTRMPRKSQPSLRNQYKG